MAKRHPHTQAKPSDLADDPVLAFLADAPLDDEPTTDDDRQAVAEAWQDLRHREAEAARANSGANGSTAG
jgi:hypothetical protein